MQKIFRLLLVAAAVIIGAIWFIHWSKTRALNSGDVHVRNQPLNTAPRPATPEAATANQPEASQEVASNNSEAPSSNSSEGGQQNSITSLPAAETITRNPSGNGIVNVGGGKFQLYRQGDLTYRLNTETGQACVLFATNELWRKPLVYDHGCANH